MVNNSLNESNNDIGSQKDFIDEQFSEKNSNKSAIEPGFSFDKSKIREKRLDLAHDKTIRSKRKFYIYNIALVKITFFLVMLLIFVVAIIFLLAKYAKDFV